MKSYGGLCHLLFLAQLLQSLYHMIPVAAIDVAQNEHQQNSPGPQPESEEEAIITECDVVIVGGGPTGLAAALTLSHPPYNCKCVLLEANPKFSSAYDPSKAYMYLVNGRGQKLTTKFPLLQQKLAERGVVPAAFVTIPGNPEKPLPKEAYGTEDADEDKDKMVDGSSKQGKKRKWKLPSLVPTMKSRSLAKIRTGAKGSPVNYWIQRHVLAEIMKEVIDETLHVNDSAPDSSKGSVDVLMGREFLNARPANALGNKQEKIMVEIKDSSTQQAHLIQCQLVVGADGYRSKVSTAPRSM
jgi:2-polyprenyl-6-methoxyphenol hydroxylase-like FAD-dependent oxidoreductase